MNKKIFYLFRMSGNNNLNGLTRQLGYVRIDPSSNYKNPTLKRKRMINIRRVNNTSLKKRYVNNSEERHRSFLLSKRKMNASKKAIDCYVEANECLGEAEGIYMSSTLTAVVNAMKTDLPLESRTIVIDSTKDLVDAVKYKLDLVKRETLKAKESATKASLPNTTAEEAEEEASKAETASQEALKQKKGVEKAAKAVETAVKSKIKSELDKMKKQQTLSARNSRATTRSRRAEGFNRLNLR